MKTTGSILFATILLVLVPAIILAFRPTAYISTGGTTRKVSWFLRTPPSCCFYPKPLTTVPIARRQSTLFKGSVNNSPSSLSAQEENESSDSSANVNNHRWRQRQWIFRRSATAGIVMSRLMNPLQFANIDNDNNQHQVVLLAGSSSSSSVGVGGVIKNIWGRIKKLHDPKVYIILSIVAGIRWNWMLRSIFYWFGFGFLIKWYRARYVFKIPVWDRQPNWNNVITSKEQEKELRAMTCKNCGSTLFIAKSREFFFEGATGIGGLGCFTCGAKGKDNFIEDRDRIVEDVAEMDDYFEYERPLDLVSAYERRKLLKEAKGDEEKANQILSQRLESGNTTDTNNTDDAAAAVSEMTDSESQEKDEEEMPEDNEEPQQQPEAVIVKEPKKSSPPPPQPHSPAPKSSPGPSLSRSKPAASDSSSSGSSSSKSSSSSSVNDADLDLLGMDDF